MRGLVIKNQFSIDDYKLIQDIKSKDGLFTVVMFLLMIGIFIILCKFDFSVYEKYSLIKEDNNFIVLVNSIKINEFKNNKFIYINDKKYRFKIVKIDQNYTSIEDNIYQSIYVYPYNYKTDAVITEGYFLKSKKPLYKLIIDFIRGGMQ